MTAGRPDKLSEARHEAIVEAFEKGASDSMAADIAGIATKTIPRWVSKGLEDLENDIDSKFSRFCLSVKKAKGERDIKLTSIVEDAAKTQWQAAMRLLEARRASEFARNCEELKEIDKLHKEYIELKEFIIKKFNGEIENGCSEDEHDGKSQD